MPAGGSAPAVTWCRGAQVCTAETDSEGRPTIQYVVKAHPGKRGVQVWVYYPGQKHAPRYPLAVGAKDAADGRVAAHRHYRSRAAR